MIGAMSKQAIPLAPHPEAPAIQDDLPAVIRRLARILAALHGAAPDAPPVAGTAAPAWHYHVHDAAEILERLAGLLSKGKFPVDVVSRRRQRTAAKTLRALMKSDQPSANSKQPLPAPRGPIDVTRAP